MSQLKALQLLGNLDFKYKMERPAAYVPRISEEYEQSDKRSKPSKPTLSENYAECIGVLRATWLKKQTRKTEYVSYGTAFAVGPHLILTCTHNLYHEELDRVADKVIFIPNHTGYILTDTSQYHSIEENYYQFIPLDTGETLADEPTINELCMVIVSKPIEASKYIKIGVLQPKQEETVEIVGFPSENFSTKSNLLAVSLTRKHLKGLIASIQGNIINHTLKTLVGMSGSAILYQIGTEMVAIGIHTHCGYNKLNRGIVFNQNIIKNILQFESNLTTFSRIPLELNYVDEFGFELYPRVSILSPDMHLQLSNCTNRSCEFNQQYEELLQQFNKNLISLYNSLCQNASLFDDHSSY